MTNKTYDHSQFLQLLHPLTLEEVFNTFIEAKTGTDPGEFIPLRILEAIAEISTELIEEDYFLTPDEMGLNK